MRNSTGHFPWHLCAGVILVCAAFTVAAYALGVGPLLERHDREIALRQQLRDRQAEAAQLASTLAGLRGELSQVLAELERMPLRLQPATRINQRIEAVARLATECGLALDEVRPGGPVDGAHYQTVPVRIVGAGSYPACGTFLRKMRDTFGDMGVRTFTAKNNGGAPASPAALFQAELVWFTELPHK